MNKTEADLHMFSIKHIEKSQGMMSFLIQQTESVFVSIVRETIILNNTIMRGGTG